MQSATSLNSTAWTGSPAVEAPVQDSNNPFGYMGGAEFMQLLLAQLRNQNPLEPLNDQEMMSQLTSINSLQELQKINQTLMALASSNQLAEAASLMGKTAQVSAGDGQIYEGVVTGVSLDDGQIILWFGEQGFPLSDLIRVSAGTQEGEPND